MNGPLHVSGGIIIKPPCCSTLFWYQNSRQNAVVAGKVESRERHVLNELLLSGIVLPRALNREGVLLEKDEILRVDIAL